MTRVALQTAIPSATGVFITPRFTKAIPVVRAVRTMSRKNIVKYTLLFVTW